MTKKWYLMSLGVLLTWQLFGTSLWGQDRECGTVVTPEQVRFERQWQTLVESLRAPRTGDHYQIPLAAHIVRQSNGTGGLTPEQLQIAIDTSNAYAAQTNVSFYQYGSIDYIDDDYFYFAMDTYEKYDTLRRIRPAAEAVNVYFVPETSISGFPYCGLSSYPGSGLQGIIMNNHCVDPSYSRSTLFHEVGHYFALYHTHETAFGAECPSGSNCATAGDLFCDTEADPDLNGHVTAAPECVYDQYADTPPECDGTPYDPPVHNIMSYSSKLCRVDMSPQQNDKFRLTLESVRTELAYGVNGFFLRPPRIVDMPVPSGAIADTAFVLTYVEDDTVMILSALSTTGEFQVSASLPAAIDKTDTLTIQLTFDATSLVGVCDLGIYEDTIVITTSKPGTLPLRVPVSAAVVFGVPSYTEKMLGPSCLPFNAAVTPGVGNQSASAFVIQGKNILFDGSLLIAMLDGGDTVAYMDVYNRSDFTAIQDYQQGVDTLGRITQKTSFVTKDSRFAGDVTYTYGWNTPHADSCRYVIVDCTIKNPCDATTTFLAGAFFDFDVESDYQWDHGWAIPADSMVIVRNEDDSRIGALVLLNSCNDGQRFRVVDNQNVIWPTNGLLPGSAYRLLAEPLTGPTIDYRDVSVLLSFGPSTLETGGAVSFRYAFIGSYPGSETLSQIKTSLRTVGASRDNCPYICGDANGDESVDISDVVYVIAYIFQGGPGPEPLAAGDATCDGTVDISDAVYLIAFIFAGGPAPCAPC